MEWFAFLRQVSLFSAVMNACYTVGDIDSILSLGKQLRAQSLTPDDTAFHLIVTCHICKSVRAVTLLKDVFLHTKSHIKPLNEYQGSKWFWTEKRSRKT